MPGGLRAGQMDDQEKTELFRRGVEQFNAGEFFEAHESWELVWLPAPEPDKTFLQGITQVSAAFFHFAQGNREGAESLLRKGLQKLERFPEDYRGLRLEELRGELRTWHRAIVRGRAHPHQRPRIKWVGGV
jgi:predicted metal-dependent hydrolase